MMLNFSIETYLTAGIPVAWMLASNGTEETIAYFIFLVKQRSSHIIPIRVMSDRDMAQINACKRVYTAAMILLCWWHVLHAWQQHISVTAHPELWEALKRWVRIQDELEFQATWMTIQKLSPPSFLSYLEKYWMPQEFLVMWSAIYRKGRNINEMSDTNMLVEAYVMFLLFCC